MLVTSDKIHTLIPQRPPIVMVDELLTCDDTRATSCFSIKPDNLFVENGAFSESGLLENIAQTAAAKAGYAFVQAHKPVPKGFIGAMKGIRIQALPWAGEQIETTVEVLDDIFGITLIRGEVYCRKTLVAACEMKIVLINEKQR
jgi:predicted hotdog family 3-hydroxylacyl-ACP dehydratase